MSLAYIRAAYGVPAKRGGRVKYGDQYGTITSARGPYLRVRFEGETYPRLLHPTWHVEYLHAESVSADKGA